MFHIGVATQHPPLPEPGQLSDTGIDFIRQCLTIDPASRPTADEALRHRWLASPEPHGVQDAAGNMANLLPQMKKAFDARKTFRKAVFSMMAMKRMSTMALSPRAHALGKDIEQYKEESEKVCPRAPLSLALVTIDSRATAGKRRRGPRRRALRARGLGRVVLGARHAEPR